MRHFIRVICGLCLIISWQICQAKEYRIINTDIRIMLNEDGSLDVDETRTYSFRGSFREAFRIFPHAEGVSFSHFRVYENGQALQQGNPREPGNFRVVERRDETRVEWFYRARNIERNFTISFRLHGAVERYEDAAVLYFQAIAGDWDVAHENVRVRIFPPYQDEPLALLQWWHGSYDINSEIDSSGIIYAQAPEIEPGRIMEVRVLYPPELFPDLRQQQGKVSPGIIREEEQWAEEANRQRLLEMEQEVLRQQRYALGRQLIIPLALLYIILWLWLYNRYGKRTGPDFYPEFSRSLPSRHRPAYVNYLMNNTMLGNNALVATIFELGSRRFLKIKELQDDKGKTKLVFELDREHFQNNKLKLEPWEVSLLEFMFDDLANGADVLEQAVMKKNASKLNKFFLKWSKQVKKEAEKLEWFDKQSARNRNLGMIISLLSLILAVPLIILYGPIMIIMFILVVGSFIVSLTFFKRSEEGEVEYRKWENIKDYLKKYEPKNDPVEKLPDSISDYLIYGVALNLGNKFTEKLTYDLQASTYNAWLFWIIIHQSRMHALSKTVNDVVTTTGSAFTTSTGGGGTMGGGGGVSAGGGGAR
jgi:uncharacterized membrane protein